MARRITVQFIGDASSLNRAVASAEGSTGNMVGKLKKLGAVAGVALAAAGVALVKFGGDSVAAASDMNETLSKSKVIFGDQARMMSKWAAGAAKSAGLSKQAALESAASFGDMFTQIGFAGKQAAGMSKGVVQLSADLGSFNNLPTAEVTDMMSAAFRGEYDSLQRVIPNINAARVEHKALAMTGKEAASELTAQEKAAATLAIVHKDGARAAGDFARTSGGLANQQKILAAQFENIKAKVGKALLPVVTRMVTFLNSSGIPALRQTWAVLKDKLGPVIKWVGDTFKRVSGSMSGDAAKNLGMIRDIISGVVSIVKSLWARFGDSLIAITKSVFGLLRSIIGGGLRIIRGVVRIISGALKGDWSKVWAGIKDILKGALQIIIALVKNSMTVLKVVWKAAWGVIRDVLKAAWGGIKSAVSAGIDKLVDWLGGLKDRFVNVLGGLVVKATNIGRDIIGGILSGLRARAGEVMDFLRNMAGDALQAVKDKLGIHSPSREFAKVGNYAAAGLVQGWDEWAPKVIDTPVELVKKSVATAASVSRASGGGPGRQGQGSGQGAAVDQRPIVVDLYIDGKRIHEALVRRKRQTGMALGLA